MKTLISCLAVLLLVSSVFSITPKEGSMVFSKGCSTYMFPVVFVYQNGNMRTSDFQASNKTVASWGKVDERHFFVKTTVGDSFYCATLPTSYSGMGWVNKKQPQSYFNGVYYNATKDSVYMLDYPNRNGIDFFNSDISGGISISHLVYRDSGSQCSTPYINFGRSILCYNPISPLPFGNVFVIADTAESRAGYKVQWVCADKRFVPDSLDTLNCGSNFYDYDGIKGFLVVVPDDQNHYEFVSVNGKRFVIPWLIQDTANKYRNAVMDSWEWAKACAKPVSAKYLEKYPLAGTVAVSYRTCKYLLKNKNFGSKKFEVMSLFGLKEISDSDALKNYSVDWQSKLIEVPDAVFANYIIVDNGTKIAPAQRQIMKQSLFQKVSGQSVAYDILGRKVGSLTSSVRRVSGLKIVSSSSRTQKVIDLFR